MAKNKDKKKKDRERRVAQKKLATQKRAREIADQDTEKSVPKTNKVFSAGPTPKTKQVANSKKSTFTQRRSGG